MTLRSVDLLGLLDLQELPVQRGRMVRWVQPVSRERRVGMAPTARRVHWVRPACRDQQVHQRRFSLWMKLEL